MSRFLVISAFLVLLASCAPLQAPELRGGETFKLNKVEGNKVSATAGAKIYNANWFGIKIKPSKLDLYIDGGYVGKLHLDKKVKLKRKRETQVNAPITAELDKGSLMDLMKFAGRDEVEVRLKGKAKGGVFIFSKKIEIDEKTTISGKGLGLGL